jgi:geranylgeranyl diphosphate synthase type 3
MGVNRIDDVEDNSQLRRGFPGRSLQTEPVSQSNVSSSLLVAHKIYGVPQTINCANYVYFLAFKELFKLRDLLKADENTAARAQNLEQVVTGVLSLALSRRHP